MDLSNKGMQDMGYMCSYQQYCRVQALTAELMFIWESIQLLVTKTKTTSICTGSLISLQLSKRRSGRSNFLYSRRFLPEYVPLFENLEPVDGSPRVWNLKRGNAEGWEPFALLCNFSSPFSTHIWRTLHFFSVPYYTTYMHKMTLHKCLKRVCQRRSI